MLEADARVVPLADVAEVIDQRLDEGVVFVVDVCHTRNICMIFSATLRTEGTLLESRVTALGGVLASHFFRN